MKRISAFLAAVILLAIGVPLPATAEAGTIQIAHISPVDDKEYVELVNGGDDLAVKKLQLVFYNSSGNLGQTIELNNGTWLGGASILIARAANSAEKNFDASYEKASLPNKGALQLLVNDQDYGRACWGENLPTGSQGRTLCDGVVKFTTEATSSMYSPKFGGWVPNPEPCEYNPEILADDENCVAPIVEPEPESGPNPNPDLNPDPDPKSVPQYCKHLRLNEISVAEQWIELYNVVGGGAILAENLATCVIEIPNPDNPTKPYVSYKLNQVEQIDDYYSVVHLTFAKSFTKEAEKKDGRNIYLYDENGEYSEVNYKPLGAERSYAAFADGWKITYRPTPGAENIYQQFQTCEAGKHINEATGNCVKNPDPPVECAEGQFRNPVTGRCKKIAENTLTECAEGYFRNPLTNRCKKIASDEDELKPCAEGYERNPETNRCRKIVSTAPAAFAVQPGPPTGGGAAYMLASVGVIAAAGGIILFQFRAEIATLARRIRPKLLLARQ